MRVKGVSYGVEALQDVGGLVSYRLGLHRVRPSPVHTYFELSILALL